MRNERNEGFGRAVNRGAALVDSGTVIVSNNDVICEETFVERLSSRSPTSAWAWCPGS